MSTTFIHLILTLSAALLVGLIFRRLHVPGALMVGGIIGAAALSICFEIAYVPSWGKIFAQVLTGAFLGSRIEFNGPDQLRAILRPAAILLGGYLAMTLLLGALIYAVSPLDLITALCSAIPGGTQEVPLIAEDLGATASQVAVLQFIRMLMGVALLPTLISKVPDTDLSKPQNVSPSERANLNPTGKKQGSAKHPAAFPLTLGIALICGICGKKLGVPAGTLLFSMIGTAILKLKWGFAYLPVPMKRLAQLLSGAYVGCSFHAKDLLELRYLAIPALILVAGYIGYCFLMGIVLRRFCNMSRREAMLSATPAGASDMALISSDMGVQSVTLVLVQMLRLILVPAVFPQIIHLLLLILE